MFQALEPTIPSRDDDVRSEIEEIARSAEHQFAERRTAEFASVASRKRLARVVWIGGILIAVQVALLGYQLAVREKPVAAHRTQAHPLENEQTCAGAKYRTFRAMVAFRKDHGRWPNVLGELVGKYVPGLPTDPRTGLPLVYGTEGEGFTLDCN